MYPTSNDYNDAILENARAHKLKGNVNGTPFTGKNVIRGSFVVKNQMCPATAIELGGVYVGECDLVFTTEFATSLGIRGSWKGVVLTPEIGVELADATFEYVPMGVYTVEEAQWTTGGLKIIAYDNMSKFDKNLPFTTSSGQIYDFLNLACQDCYVTLGMSPEDVQALPNGTEALSTYTESSMQTYRDLISACASACCCFATIDRQGCLVLVPFPDTSTTDGAITEKQRYSTSFSDYSSYYTQLKVNNAEDGTTSYYQNGNVGGLTIDIGANALLQYGVDITKNRQRTAIINALEDFNATPFSVSILPNPALELGDVIQFTGGVGLGCMGVIMSYVHKVDSTKIEGYGENPATTAVVSSLAKAIEAQGKSTKEDIVTHVYKNAVAYGLSDNVEIPVVEITFATVTPKTVKTFTEVNLDLSITDPTGVASCTAYYYLNGVLESYTPVATWNNDGKHILPLMYPLENLASSTTYDWEVRLEIDGGSASVAVGDVHCILEGQGLVAVDEFNGTIKIEDTITIEYFDRDFLDLAEDVDLTTEGGGIDNVLVNENYDYIVTENDDFITRS